MVKNTTNYLKVLAVVAKKDFTIEFRSLETILASMSFALLVVAIFAITLNLTIEENRVVAPVVLWAGLAFASIVSVLRSYDNESSEGAGELILLAPVGREVLTLSKAFSNFVFLSVTAVLAILLSNFFLNIPLLRFDILLVTVLTIAGFSFLSSLFGAITLRSKERSILAVLLFVPFSMPLIQAAVSITTNVLSGESLLENWVGVVFILVANLIYALVLILVSPLIFEE